MISPARVWIVALIGVLFSLGACGSDDGGASRSASIGPSGGSVTSSDGKVTLTIPAGALTQTIAVSIDKIADGASPDPDYIAGTTYQLTSPSVTLSAPATLKYDLKDAIRTQVVTGLHVTDTQLVGACDATTPSCYVALGSGPCPDDHDKLSGLVSTANGTGTAPVWTQKCDLSDPPQPLLATLSPTTVISNTWEPGTDILSGGLGALSSTVFAALDTTLRLNVLGSSLAQPIDGTLFGKPNEQAATITVTPSRPAAIAQYKYTFENGFGINKDGSAIDTLDFPGVFLGQNTTGTFSQKLSSFLVPNATYAYLLLGVYALDAGGNVLATNAELVPVLYGTQLQVVLNANTNTVTTSGGAVLLSALVPNALGGNTNKLELFEGATKVGDFVQMGGYEYTVKYTQADNGAHTYTAKVTTIQNQTAISNPVTVTVAINAVPTFDLYVDPVAGADTNAGTLAAPFKTITHAGAVATSGQRIGLLDGTYLEGTTAGTCDGRSVGIPAGVTLQSVHPRAAVIGNVSLTSAGSATYTDLTLDGGTNGSCTGIVGSNGIITVSGTKFGNGAHFVLNGTAVATLAPGTLTGFYNSGTNALIAQLTNSAQLTIHGGTWDGGPTTTNCGASQITVEGAASVVLDGVTVQNYPGTVVAANGGSVTLENNTVFDHDGYAACQGVAILSGSGNTLAMSSSTIKNATMSNAIVVGNGPATVNLTASTLSGNFRGIFHDTSFGDGTGNVTIANSTISGTTNEAFDWADLLALTLSVRNSQITGNASGIVVNSGAGSVVDLGTSASLGGNTIQSTNVGVALTGGSAFTASAVGNTWVLGNEGADAAGHYAAALVPGPITMGLNYQLVSGSSIQF